MGLHRGQRHSGSSRYVRQIHLFHETHHKNAALLVGEFLKRLVDHLDSLFRDQLCFRGAGVTGQVLTTSWASTAVAAAFFQKRNFWLLVGREPG
jgi:hypothetical protein